MMTSKSFTNVNPFPYLHLVITFKACTTTIHFCPLHSLLPPQFLTLSTSPASFLLVFENRHLSTPQLPSPHPFVLHPLPVPLN